MTRPAAFVLASASPRRRELLRAAGWEFTVAPSGVDESFDRDAFGSSVEIALEIARRKARAVAEIHPGALVLGADTMVVTEDDDILGIPRDRADGARMLRLLSARWHQVHTAVVLERHGATYAAVDTARVRFRPLSEEDIVRYLETGEADDKAGAYGYQGEGRGLVVEVQGDPQTVIGLPLKLVREGLERLQPELAPS